MADVPAASTPIPVGPCSRSATRPARRRAPSIVVRQAGVLLLEALIAILLFALGVLGLVGLQAQSMRATDASRYRAEAASLAGTLVASMWTGDAATLEANYDSRGGGPGYADFQSKVRARFGRVWITDPKVEFDAAKAPSSASVFVTITLAWRMPGEPSPSLHVASAVVGRNP